MAAQALRVWDPLVRAVHWSLAALILVDLFNEAGANPWHRYLGYAAGALVMVRLAWGVLGREHVRLASIAKKAAMARCYVGASGSRDKRHIYVAHTPLGACMVLVMWSLILAVVVTGWMQQLDAFWGDELMQRTHGIAAYVLGACVLVHVGGVLVTSAGSGVNLVKGMITGKKAAPPGSVSET
jgi:cytochrome b